MGLSRSIHLPKATQILAVIILRLLLLAIHYQGTSLPLLSLLPTKVITLLLIASSVIIAVRIILICILLIIRLERVVQQVSSTTTLTLVVVGIVCNL